MTSAHCCFGQILEISSCLSKFEMHEMHLIPFLGKKKCFLNMYIQKMPVYVSYIGLLLQAQVGLYVWTVL